MREDVIDKNFYYKQLADLSRKQDCFDDMIVTNFYETLCVDIYDYNSFFKMYNLLPSITHSSQFLNYAYDRKDNHFWIRASWEDEETVLKMVETIKLIVETCMKENSKFFDCFHKVNDILKY